MTSTRIAQMVEELRTKLGDEQADEVEELWNELRNYLETPITPLSQRPLS